jgi:hypothetical protein
LKLRNFSAKQLAFSEIGLTSDEYKAVMSNDDLLSDSLKNRIHQAAMALPVNVSF